MAANINVHGFQLRLVVVYAPTDADSDNQMQIFYRNLRKVIDKTNFKNHKLVVGGSFNATTSCSLQCCYYDSIKIIHNESNDNGNRLKSLCRNHQLSMLAMFFKHWCRHRYTCYSNDGKTKKVLVYLLVKKFLQRYILDCRVQHSINIDSDHRALVACLRTPCTKLAIGNPT